MNNEWPHVTSVKRAYAPEEDKEWSGMNMRAVLRPCSKLEVVHLRMSISSKK